MWYIAIEENIDYLAHHGIKGQRWGIRRFQNEDGTLTKQGKLRYTKQLVKSFKKNKNTNLIKDDIKYLLDKHPEVQEAFSKFANMSKSSIDIENKYKKSPEYKQAIEKTKKATDKYCKGQGIEINPNNKHYNNVWNYYFYEYGQGSGFYGYEDEARKKFYKNNPDLSKKDKEYDKAWKDYYNKCNKLVDSVLDEKLKGTYINNKHVTGDRLDYNFRNMLEDEMISRNKK